MSLGYVAIVGSRDVPLEYLELLIRLGKTYTDLGYHISSGDAFGSDRAGWYGARLSERYEPDLSRIYVLDSKLNQTRAREHGFIVAQDYLECWTIATAMALEARGSWNGLKDQYQRDLHTRNVYQIHGHTLSEPIKALIYYARPIGILEREICSGGTNTTLQVAKRAGIEPRVNLATEKGYNWVIDFLKQHEVSDDYDEDIEWHEILKPNDPRLEYLS